MDRFDEVLTLRDVAAELRCSTVTVRRAIKEGNAPPYFRVGNRYRWRREVLTEWMKNGGKQDE